MITVSRAEWDARPPTSATPLTLDRVGLFIVHYSGAARSQTVRSIQDYCMDVKGHSDIDYNAIVKDGKHFVGRGWNIGGHTLNNNSISYGVCVVGQDGDATPGDMNCVREIYDIVCAKLGRQITKTDHRKVLGLSYTDCPGDELDSWVAAGMPYMTGDDMINEEDFRALVWRVYEGIIQLKPEIDNHVTGVEPNEFARVLQQLAADVAELKAKPTAALSDEDLAKLAALIPKPPTAQEIADLLAARLAQ